MSELYYSKLQTDDIIELKKNIITNSTHTECPVCHYSYDNSQLQKIKLECNHCICKSCFIQTAVLPKSCFTKSRFFQWSFYPNNPHPLILQNPDIFLNSK